MIERFNVDPISVTTTYVVPLLLINWMVAAIEAEFIDLDPDGKKAIRILAFVPILNIIIAFWLFMVMLEHMI